MVVVDVGAAPGSWCQVVADIVQPNVYAGAFILGIDLQVRCFSLLYLKNRFAVNEFMRCKLAV